MSNRKKILHIIHSLDSGGCENMLLRTLPKLTQFDHKILTLKQPGELAPQFIASGIPVETLRYKNFFDISSFLRLREMVRRESPDIILTYLFHADMIARLGLFKVTNAPRIPFLRTTYNHPKYLIARIFEQLTRPLVHQYLANSEAVKDFYVRHLRVRPEKITVIPNGIDLNFFDSLKPDYQLQDSLAIPQENFIIICVANLHINKGHSYLLTAFEKFYQEYPQSTLLLVGEGKEHDALKKQIQGYRSKENILFLGRRKDVAKLLILSDLFVLPTLFEGQSNAILEAMAARIPVITTDIPENKVLLENDASALLILPQDSESLYQALQKARQDKEFREKIARAARKNIEDSFSLEKIQMRWENILNNVIAKS